MRTLMPMISGVDRVLADFTDAEKDTIADYLQKVVGTYRAQLPEKKLLQQLRSEIASESA